MEILTLVRLVAEVHESIVEWNRLLPQAPCPTQGPEATKHSRGHSEQLLKVGRLRIGTSLWIAHASIHTRGGHFVVPSPGDFAWRQDVQHERGRMEPRMHLR